MNHTDKQLKAVLAKMLRKQTKLANFFWHIDEDGCFTRQIEDTELLHLCWLVEEKLTDDEWDNYVDRFEIVSNRNLLHATWQQRVIALAKVKGIEI